MKSEKLIVGNMKMNLSATEISEYLKKFQFDDPQDQVVICPSAVYIPYFLKQPYKVGIQNVFFRDKGAYTGEISVSQVASLGIEYVIVGHSERRIYFKESDQDINKKVISALKYGFTVILCIGETAEEKGLLKTARVLKRQLLNCLRNVDTHYFSKIIIAYEPVWAIGSDVTPTLMEIEETIQYIKGIVLQYFGHEDIRVMYGGSVNSKNIEELNQISNVSGFLVGGASIRAEEFLKIIEVTVKK